MTMSKIINKIVKYLYIIVDFIYKNTVEVIVNFSSNFFKSSKRMPFRNERQDESTQGPKENSETELTMLSKKERKRRRNKKGKTGKDKNNDANIIYHKNIIKGEIQLEIEVKNEEDNMINAYTKLEGLGFISVKTVKNRQNKQISMFEIGNEENHVSFWTEHTATQGENIKKKINPYVYTNNLNFDYKLFRKLSSTLNTGGNVLMVGDGRDNIYITEITQTKLLNVIESSKSKSLMCFAKLQLKESLIYSGSIIYNESNLYIVDKGIKIGKDNILIMAYCINNYHENIKIISNKEIEYLDRGYELYKPMGKLYSKFKIMNLSGYVNEDIVMMRGWKSFIGSRIKPKIIPCIYNKQQFGNIMHLVIIVDHDDMLGEDMIWWLIKTIKPMYIHIFQLRIIPHPLMLITKGEPSGILVAPFGWPKQILEVMHANTLTTLTNVLDKKETYITVLVSKNIYSPALSGTIQYLIDKSYKYKLKYVTDRMEAEIDDAIIRLSENVWNDKVIAYKEDSLINYRLTYLKYKYLNAKKSKVVMLKQEVEEGNKTDEIIE